MKEKKFHCPHGGSEGLFRKTTLVWSLYRCAWGHWTSAIVVRVRREVPRGLPSTQKIARPKRTLWKWHLDALDFRSNDTLAVSMPVTLVMASAQIRPWCQVRGDVAIWSLLCAAHIQVCLPDKREGGRRQVGKEQLGHTQLSQGALLSPSISRKRAEYPLTQNYYLRKIILK